MCLVECATRMWHRVTGPGHGSGIVWAQGCVWEGSHDYGRSDCVEHNRDGDQPAGVTGLNRGKPSGTGQKTELIRFICTWGIQIKVLENYLSVTDIRDPSCRGSCKFIHTCTLSCTSCWVIQKMQVNNF